MDIATISGLVNKSLQDNAFDDCFLIEIKIHNKRIEVYIDSDENVSFEKCKIISRSLEKVLDEKKWFGDSYVLEVSSSGVGKPLIMPRQFRKNVGRQINIKTVDGDKISGYLVDADDEKISIEWEEKVKEGKKKKTIIQNRNFLYTNVKEAKIKVSFK